MRWRLVPPQRVDDPECTEILVHDRASDPVHHVAHPLDTLTASALPMVVERKVGGALRGARLRHGPVEGRRGLKPGEHVSSTIPAFVDVGTRYEQAGPPHDLPHGHLVGDCVRDVGEQHGNRTLVHSHLPGSVLDYALEAKALKGVNERRTEVLEVMGGGRPARARRCGC